MRKLTSIGRFKILIFTLLISVFTCALAQTDSEEERIGKLLEGTIYATSHRKSSDGIQDGCEIEFVAIGRDFSTKNGDFVKLSGSFSFRATSKDKFIGHMLKIGIYDKSSTKAVAPNYAFIRSANGSAPPGTFKAASDTDGYALFMGAINNEILDAYESMLKNKEIIIGFNRKPKQQDVTMKIDLTVVDTKMGNDGAIVRERSEATVRDFYSCVSALLKGLK